MDLATLPLYVRAGALLPMGPVIQHTGEGGDGSLTIRVHPGADGVFTLYEDDGLSFNHRQGDWMGIRMEWNDARRRLTLRLLEGSRLREPGRREIELRVAGGKAARTVVFEGRPLDVRL